MKFVYCFLVLAFVFCFIQVRAQTDQTDQPTPTTAPYTPYYIPLPDDGYTPLHTATVNDPSMNLFSTHFMCPVIDPLLGYALANFRGGRYSFSFTASTQYAILFADGTQTGTVSGPWSYTRAYNQPGTHWAYLRDLSTGNIVDYVQIEVITHTVFTGDCYNRMATDENGLTGPDGGPLPPSDWQSGALPPPYTPSNN